MSSAKGVQTMDTLEALYKLALMLILVLSQNVLADIVSINSPSLTWRPDNQVIWFKEPLEPISEEESGVIFVLEEKDYPISLFEDYAGVGQVSGVATLPSDDLVIFHRSTREWNEETFDDFNRVRDPKPEDNLIKSDTLMTLSGNDGSARETFGSNMFYMPHGIASDSKGNLWVTDVARHQVIRLPTGKASQLTGLGLKGRWDVKPDIILGHRFTPGNDTEYFCKPSEVKVSSSGKLVYVADGYCNNRIQVFDGQGRYVSTISQGFSPGSIVHSITLIESRNMICAADRDNRKILCFEAGLDGDLSRMGTLITEHIYPLGQVYAIVALGSNNLLVSSKKPTSNRYDLAILNLISHEVKPIWVSSDLLEPHSLTVSNDGNYVYAADISHSAYKKVFQFKVIRGTV